MAFVEIESNKFIYDAKMQTVQNQFNNEQVSK